MIEEKSTRRLKSMAMLLKPSVQLGKKGLVQESIIEIKNQLRNKGLVKVKFLRAAFVDSDKRSLAEEIGLRTESRLVSLVGFTASYYRPAEKKPERRRQS